MIYSVVPLDTPLEKDIPEEERKAIQEWQNVWIACNEREISLVKSGKIKESEIRKFLAHLHRGEILEAELQGLPNPIHKRYTNWDGSKFIESCIQIKREQIDILHQYLIWLYDIRGGEKLMKPKMIIAIGYKNTIGLNGTLPWRCSEDLKHFKEKTMGCKLLVGRKTYEKMPPLPGRELLIVGKGHYTLQEALDLEPDWIIGGESIYKQTMHLCSEIHISHIHDDTLGDSFFEVPKDFPKGKIRNYYFTANKK